MKKLLVVLSLLAALLLFVVSCGEEKLPPDGDGENNSETGNEGGENQEEANKDPVDDSKINLADREYTVVYNPYQSAEKQLAQSFAEAFEEKLGVKPKTASFTAKPTEYEILFGTVSTRSECTDILATLKPYSKDDVSLYSIAFSGTKLIITATDEAALEAAAEKLLSYAEGDKLTLAKDFSETVVTYADGAEKVSCSLSEFCGRSLLASVSVNGVELNGFTPAVYNYGAFYAASENYPKVTAKALNAKAEVNVVQAADNNGSAKITVKSEDGTAESVYTIGFSFADSINVASEIVNKNGAGGVVTFVFDDGGQKTADIIVSKFLSKYPSLHLSFALITQALAELELEGEKYVVDENGNYSITPIKNKYTPEFEESVFKGKDYQYTYEFWKEVAAREGVELLSHSHTHDNWGYTDTNGKITKELKASQQILKRLCGEDSLTYILPGVGAVGSGEVYLNLLENGGYYIGARSGKTTPWSFGEMVNYASFLKDVSNRFAIYSYAVNYCETQLDETTSDPQDFTTNASSSYADCIAAGIPLWTGYVDKAVETGGWACFCFHNIVFDNEDSNLKWRVYESQADAMFAYVQQLSDEGKLWIANYTEAQIYCNEWSTATVNTVLSSDTSVTVSITDNEDDGIYNMPLTVKVPVPKSWTTAQCTSEDATEVLELHENEDGTKFVYVDAVPDGPEVVITEIVR